MVLLVGDDNIDIILRAQTMVGDAEKAVSIRWKIDANDFWGLVRYDVEETGILVSESVMVLSPNSGGQKDVLDFWFSILRQKLGTLV